MMHLAEINIGRIRYDIDDPRMAEFVNNLDRINGLAERAAGFVWRYKDESGAAVETPLNGDPRLIPNISVWESPEALRAFAFDTLHRVFYTKRGDWFEKLGDGHFAMWWVPVGHRPTVEEAMERLAHLNAHGPSDHAFDWSVLENAEAIRAERCA